MGKRMWGNEYRAATVCIDQYERRVPEGRLYNQAIPEGRSFHGLVSFLLTMEDLLNNLQFPQSFDAVRSFRDGPGDRQAPSVPDQEDRHAGRLATFTVRVIFRQNASWQGSVNWMEGKRERSFRSVLELALLMDSVLTGREDA